MLFYVLGLKSTTSIADALQKCFAIDHAKMLSIATALTTPKQCLQLTLVGRAATNLHSSVDPTFFTITVPFGADALVHPNVVMWVTAIVLRAAGEAGSAYKLYNSTLAWLRNLFLEPGVGPICEQLCKTQSNLFELKVEGLDAGILTPERSIGEIIASVAPSLCGGMPLPIHVSAIRAELARKAAALDNMRALETPGVKAYMEANNITNPTTARDCMTAFERPGVKAYMVANNLKTPTTARNRMTVLKTPGVKAYMAKHNIKNPTAALHYMQVSDITTEQKARVLFLSVSKDTNLTEAELEIMMSANKNKALKQIAWCLSSTDGGTPKASDLAHAMINEAAARKVFRSASNCGTDRYRPDTELNLLYIAAQAALKDMLPTAHQLKVYEAKLKKEAKAAGMKRSASETGDGGGGGGAAAKKAK
jgi:hypothetical protein